MTLESNHRIAGTPEQVVGELAAISAAGVDGMTFGWVDYRDGIQQLETELLPLMKQAGLRA